MSVGLPKAGTNERPQWLQQQQQPLHQQQLKYTSKSKVLPQERLSSDPRVSSEIPSSVPASSYTLWLIGRKQTLRINCERKSRLRGGGYIGFCRGGGRFRCRASPVSAASEAVNESNDAECRKFWEEGKG
eukprot:GHVQ01037281.1.p1 GENE.GHVQ01037281.1~~GHVQ01037281.1.p1  ORF type:complete len:130 (+),score=25.62 GHVQ01037281.1:1055-1444(+)